MTAYSSLPLSHRVAGFLSGAIAMLAVAAPLDAAQKREQETETKQGTIVEIQQKGRGRLLIVEIDGEQQKVPVTAKLNLQILATGDAGFVRPGQYLSASALLSNDKLFIKSLTIRTARKGQRVPPGRIEKLPAEVGESMQAYDVSGTILAAQPNPDNPDHLDVALKTAGPDVPILIEPGAAVTVSCSDPERIPADAAAEVEIAQLRGGRTSIVGITIRLTEALTAAEYFDDEPKAKDPLKSDDAESDSKQ